MKKHLIISVVLILCSCHFFNELSFDESLTTKINSKYKEEQNPIDLKKISNFEWDNYIVIGCYQSPDRIGKKLNIDLSNISEYATSNESKRVLVFIKNKKAIKICDVDSDIKFIETNRLKEVNINSIE
jgi:hypothetical protein